MARRPAFASTVMVMGEAARDADPPATKAASNSEPPTRPLRTTDRRWAEWGGRGDMGKDLLEVCKTHQTRQVGAPDPIFPISPRFHYPPVVLERDERLSCPLVPHSSVLLPRIARTRVEPVDASIVSTIHEEQTP